MRSRSARASAAALTLATISAFGIVSLPSKWPQRFGYSLVLDLDGVGAGALQHLDRAGHVERVAEAGVGIDHDRPREHVTDRGNVVGKLRQRHEPIVGNPEVGVRDAGAGDIGGREAEVRNHPRRQRIGHAGRRGPAAAPRRAYPTRHVRPLRLRAGGRSARRRPAPARHAREAPRSAGCVGGAAAGAPASRRAGAHRRRRPPRPPARRAQHVHALDAGGLRAADPDRT